MKYKCLIILSESSSASSACQGLITRSARNVKLIEKTRHIEHETLYWTKAASMLGMPQIDMVDSEVPIPADKARADLRALLDDNLGELPLPEDDEELVMQGWRLLCMHYAPVFLEKSTQHLCQWSALELMLQCAERFEELDFLFIGLVRNPMDIIYSRFQRWGTRPEKLELQWYIAYSNLLKLKECLGDRLVMIRYEDMTRSPAVLQPVFDFCRMRKPLEKSPLNHPAVQKWRTDPFFGFSLSDESLQLARRLGYKDHTLLNRSYPLWPVIRNISRVRRRVEGSVRNNLRAALGAVGLLDPERKARPRS